MATTKSSGSSRLGRDSAGQRLGVKKSDGQQVAIGNIIIRQRGSKFYAGKNVKIGNDDTIYSMKDGKVKFTNRIVKNFNKLSRKVKVVNVISH